MALTATELVYVADTTDRTNAAYTTSSAAVTAGSLLLAGVVLSRASGATPNTPTIAGWGLTWTLVDPDSGFFFKTTGNDAKSWVYAALAPAGAASAAFTATIVDAHVGCIIEVVQVTGDFTACTVPTDAIVQSKRGPAAANTNATASTTYTLTWDASPASTSRGLLFWFQNNNGGATPDAGGNFAELGDRAVSTPSLMIESQFSSNADQSVDTTPLSQTANYAEVYFEIRERVLNTKTVLVDATADIVSAGFKDIARSAAIDATANVVSVPQRDVLRVAAIGATADVTSASLRDLLRQASVDATADIVAAGARITAEVERTVAISATADIVVAGTTASYVSIVTRGFTSFGHRLEAEKGFR